MKFEFSPYIAFQVKDYKDAVEFYKNVLGMETVKDGENETHLKCGPINFFVENSSDGNTFFEFKVEDIKKARQLLEQNRCKVTQEYSEKSLMFADPYGMKFHIWQD